MKCAAVQKVRGTEGCGGFAEELIMAIRMYSLAIVGVFSFFISNRRETLCSLFFNVLVQMIVKLSLI